MMSRIPDALIEHLNHRTMAPPRAPGQVEILESDSTRICITSANGTGKTETVLLKVLAQCCEVFHFGSFEVYDYFDPGTAGTVIIACADYVSYRDDVAERMNAVVELYGLQGYLTEDTVYGEATGYRHNMMRFTSGWKILFRWMGVAQDPRRNEGVAAHMLIINEPIPEKHMGAFMRSVTKVPGSEGVILIAATMVNQDCTPIRNLVEKEGSRWVRYRLEATARDCPWKTRAELREQLLLCPPDEVNQRIYGHWEGSKSNREFSSFTDSVLWNDLPQMEFAWSGWDHGELAGHEVVHLMLGRRGQPWDRKCCVCGEWPSKFSRWERVCLNCDSERGNGPEWDTWQWPLVVVFGSYSNMERSNYREDAEGFMAMCERLGVPIETHSFAYGDINSIGKGLVADGSADRFGGYQVNDQLAQLLGIKFRKPSMVKIAGGRTVSIKACNMAFRRGHLIVHKRCVELTRALKYWTNPKKLAKVSDKAQNARYQHLVDAFLYGASPVLSEIWEG